MDISIEMALATQSPQPCADYLVAQLTEVGLTVEAQFDEEDNVLSFHCAELSGTNLQEVVQLAVELAELEDRVEVEVASIGDPSIQVAGESPVLLYFSETAAEKRKKKKEEEDEDEEDLEDKDELKKSNEEDEPEDDEEEEDEDEEDPTPVRLKTDDEGSPGVATILKDADAHRLVARMYMMACGDDMSHFPAFWQRVDAICTDFRKHSKYVPETHHEDLIPALDGEENATVDSTITAMVEVAAKKSKPFEANRSSLLRYTMKNLSGVKGKGLGDAWIAGDVQKFTAEWAKAGGRVSKVLADNHPKATKG